MLQDTSSTSSPQSEQSIGEYDESTLVFRPVQLDHCGQEDDSEQVDVRDLIREQENINFFFRSGILEPHFSLT